VRTSRESETWSRRLEVRKKYEPESGGGGLEVIFDFSSPLIPATSLSLNPVYIASEPGAEKVEFGGETGRLKYNGQTGEGEVVVIIDNRVLVTIIGYGLSSRSFLHTFSSRIGYRALSTFTPP
jgi:hypothetical protein